jgi:hypothetical protein
MPEIYPDVRELVERWHCHAHWLVFIAICIVYLPNIPFPRDSTYIRTAAAAACPADRMSDCCVFHRRSVGHCNACVNFSGASPLLAEAQTPPTSLPIMRDSFRRITLLFTRHCSRATVSRGFVLLPPMPTPGQPLLSTATQGRPISPICHPYPSL